MENGVMIGPTTGGGKINQRRDHFNSFRSMVLTLWDLLTTFLTANKAALERENDSLRKKLKSTTALENENESLREQLRRKPVLENENSTLRAELQSQTDRLAIDIRKAQKLMRQNLVHEAAFKDLQKTLEDERQRIAKLVHENNDINGENWKLAIEIQEKRVEMEHEQAQWKEIIDEEKREKSKLLKQILKYRRQLERQK